MTILKKIAKKEIPARRSPSKKQFLASKLNQSMIWKQLDMTCLSSTEKTTPNIWDAYPLTGIFGNSGENSNETVHPSGRFSEKRQYASRYSLVLAFTGVLFRLAENSHPFFQSNGNRPCTIAFQLLTLFAFAFNSGIDQHDEAEFP